MLKAAHLVTLHYVYRKDYDLLIVSGLCTSLLLESVMKQSGPGFRLQDAEMIQQAAVDSCQILEIPK